MNRNALPLDENLDAVLEVHRRQIVATFEQYRRDHIDRWEPRPCPAPPSTPAPPT